MSEGERVAVSEGIDVNKTNESRKCIIYNCYYFFEVNLKFQQRVYYGSHDLMQKAVSLKDVATVFIKGNDYQIHFWYVSKVETINRGNNTNLIKKGGSL